MTRPTLDQLTDSASIEVAIGGRSYRFAELALEALGRLQAVIKQTVPHPLEALGPNLDTLPAVIRESLLDRAYRDALHWPPVVGTAAGSAALLGSEPGQIAALWEGLKATAPETTREEAVRIFRALRRESAADARAAKAAGRQYDGEGKAQRIFAALFGLDEPGDAAVPKDEPPPPAAAWTGP